MRKVEDRPLDDGSDISFQPLEAETTTPVPDQRQPGKRWKKMPRGWRYAAAGGALLLVLGVVLATVLPRLAPRPTTKPQPPHIAATKPATKPTQTQPGALPTLNAVAPSDKAINGTTSYDVNLTLANGIIYLITSAETKNSLYAVQENDGKLLWRYTFDPNSSSYMLPMIVNGMVYTETFTPDGVGIYTGTVTLMALQASNGHLLWSYQSRGSMSYPSVVNGIIYVGAQDGMVALQAETGSQLWAFSSGQKGAYVDNPIYVDGTLYTGVHPNDQPGPTVLYALQASDGKQIWQYKTDDPSSLITIDHGIAYVSEGSAQTTPQMIALRTSDGKQLWKTTTDGAPTSNQVILNGVMYVVAQKWFLEDPTNTPTPTSYVPTGTTLNSALIPLQALSPLLPAKAQIPHKYALSSIYAINLSDGKVQWHTTLNGGKLAWDNWLTADNGVLYTSYNSNEGQQGLGGIYALNIRDGSQLWARSLESSPGSATLANGIIYMTLQIDYIHSALAAIRASDGQQLWRYPVAAQYIDNIVQDGSKLYIGANNGLLIALDASTGKALWHFQAGN